MLISMLDGSFIDKLGFLYKIALTGMPTICSLQVKAYLDERFRLKFTTKMA